jgi:dihydropyrimidinase
LSRGRLVYDQPPLTGEEINGQTTRRFAVSFDLVVRDGTVVTASDSVAADIGVRAGRVAAIGAELAPGAVEIAAAGLLVLPGGVDVHLDAEVGGALTADDFESGTVAAACGGIITICDYAWQSRGRSLTQAIDAWKVKG